MTHLSKSYKYFVASKLIYFWKEDDYTLKISSFLKYRWSKSKQFSTKKVSAIATKKSSCFISLILVNLVVYLTVFHSLT